MKFTTNPIPVEAMTFEELIKHGIADGANLIKGMPWSFNYKDRAVSHENNDRYLVDTHTGSQIMNRDDVLVIHDGWRLHIQAADQFYQTHTKVL